MRAPQLKLGLIAHLTWQPWTKCGHRPKTCHLRMACPVPDRSAQPAQWRSALSPMQCTQSNCCTLPRLATRRTSRHFRCLHNAGLQVTPALEVAVSVLHVNHIVVSVALRMHDACHLATCALALCSRTISMVHFRRGTRSNAGAISHPGTVAPEPTKEAPSGALTPRAHRRSSMRLEDCKRHRRRVLGKRHVRFKGIAGPFLLRFIAFLITCAP